MDLGLHGKRALVTGSTAGIGWAAARALAEITDADWLRFFETNVLSGIRLARHYVAGMRARDWGRIVFVSSESALQIPAETIHYGVTKTAQLAVARGLAETDWRKRSKAPGSRSIACCLVPRRRKGSGPSWPNWRRRAARPSSIIRRFAAPAEVAAMIAYVCSVQASATTGAALLACGLAAAPVTAGVEAAVASQLSSGQEAGGVDAITRR